MEEGGGGEGKLLLLIKESSKPKNTINHLQNLLFAAQALSSPLEQDSDNSLQPSS
jgi:hypothetical protein